MATTWLDKYYGKDISKFRPTVIFDGKKKAVVRVYNASAVGYVLVTKSGRHNESAETPLHGGSADKAAFSAMKKALDDADR